jgi:hypothetical protein
MKKSILFTLSALSMLVTTIEATAQAITCPPVSDLRCNNSKWGSTDDQQWNGDNVCATSTQTLTFYRVDTQMASEGLPVNYYILEACVYNISDTTIESRLNLMYGQDPPPIVFTNPLDWKYTYPYTTCSISPLGCPFTFYHI